MQGLSYHEDDDSELNVTYEYDYYENEHGICDKATVRSFASVFLPVIYALTLVVGLAGNALVVAVYASKLRLRTLTDACILNLAISDILLLFTLPFWAADAVHGWMLGVVACKITSFLYSTNFSCGMLLLACISVDRYRALAQNASGRTGASVRKLWWLVVCLMLWVVAGGLAVPELIYSTVKHSSHGMACTDAYPHDMARATKTTLELLEVVLRFLLPFCVMVPCYYKVGRTLSQAAGVRQDRKWRALRVLLAVVAVFLLTQLPYNVVKLCRAIDTIYTLVTSCAASKALDHALQVTESLALAHACINPLLYAFLGSSFRGHVLKTAKHLGERLKRRPRRVREEPAVEISLNTRNETQSQSGSAEQDTSTFTI